MDTAIMVLVVATSISQGPTLGWRDPGMASAAFIPFHSLAACKLAKPLVIRDAQAHGWEASATCVDNPPPATGQVPTP
jgi:hypothetical protein